MTNTHHSTLSVIVAGDITVDWHILNQGQNTRLGEGWNPTLWTRACGQPGGALLYANLLESIANQLGMEKFLIQKPVLPPQLHPGDQAYHHSYAIWSLFSSQQGGAWRVERFLGLDIADPTSLKTRVLEKEVPPGTPTIIVLDDANLGFRDQPDKWPKAISAEANPDWIVVKMARPVAQGRLWEHLQAHHLDRLIPILPVKDLRHTEVHISRGLSWERTAQDVAWELIHNPCVNSLSQCAYVVVSFDTAGAVVLNNIQGKGFNLFFDPLVIEGLWGQKHPGLMIGYTTCLAAGITRQLMLNPGTPDLARGVHAGLSAARRLHSGGYAFDPKACQSLAFPMQRIADVLAEDATDFAEVQVENPVFSYEKAEDTSQEKLPHGWWTILEDRHQENLAWVAEQVVLKGAEVALADVPQGRFGHLLTVDRQEIESFRSIHSLVSEYLSKESQKRPLSIAVFGAPGSGKSFGITQVAESLAPGQIKVIEFNLSQFEGTHEIIDALHQVRDVSLSGMIPLVFWDEFDSSFEGQPLGWLRYFLAPMQDGKFRQGQIVHPIGRAIFVFAGGTSHRMENFGAHLPSETARAAKVPDFVSRLKGYVNILGPNPPEGGDGSDPYYVIRRAILVRSLLERSAPQLFEKKGGVKIPHIDSGVLNAFLGVSNYKHGIRSIETIIEMSQLSGKTAFERSSLPPEDQLGLAVETQEFISLVQALKLEGNLLEKMAQSYHSFYQKQQHQAARVEGRETSAETAWADLNDDEKEQNRAAVRDIPNKLAKVGFVMIPSRSDQPIFTFPEIDADLEKLSKMEHDRWMALKLKSGWKYGEKTNKAEKIHQSLLAWEALSQDDKEKDIALVRAIPLILAEVGYTMAKLHRHGEKG